MRQTYTGNTPELYVMYAQGNPIEYTHCGLDTWVPVAPYEDPSDLHRVSNKGYLFRKREIIQKAYMHYQNIEAMVREGNFSCKDVGQWLYEHDVSMTEHLEFTFINGKLSYVEMKDATHKTS